jgi:hypothetical protein
MVRLLTVGLALVTRNGGEGTFLHPTPAIRHAAEAVD